MPEPAGDAEIFSCGCDEIGRGEQFLLLLLGGVNGKR